MSRQKIHIPKDELVHLYLNENWSPARIGKRFGCNSVTVRSRIREAEIPLKTKSAAQMRYLKYDFSGSDIEKAYLLGFRYGDLNVYKPKGASETIVIRSHSTLTEQGDLFKEIFHSYGKITVSEGKQSTQMTCYTNTSFTFLLDKYPKHIQLWLQEEAAREWAFAAGYIDAEGTFGVYNKRARFKIDSYDYAILLDLHQLFLRYGIGSKFRAIAREGTNDYGWIWKHDVWRISVNNAHSTELLIKNLQPYLRHRKRATDAAKALKNIIERRVYGSIK